MSNYCINKLVGDISTIKESLFTAEGEFSLGIMEPKMSTALVSVDNVGLLEIDFKAECQCPFVWFANLCKKYPTIALTLYYYNPAVLTIGTLTNENGEPVVSNSISNHPLYQPEFDTEKVQYIIDSVEKEFALFKMNEFKRIRAGISDKDGLLFVTNNLKGFLHYFYEEARDILTDLYHYESEDFDEEYINLLYRFCNEDKLIDILYCHYIDTEYGFNCGFSSGFIQFIKDVVKYLEVDND